MIRNKGIIVLLIATAVTMSNVGQVYVFAEEINEVSQVNEAPYEILRTQTHESRYIKGGAEEIKYFVFHDTQNYNANGAYGEAMNIQNNPAIDASSTTSAKLYGDDKMVIKTMEFDDVDFAVGGGRNDITIYNSISYEISVAHGVDFHKAVAVAIDYFRKVIKPLYPDIQVVRHYDADTEVYGPKDCPRLINRETTWWTWEKVKALCENDDPIPFLDYCPVPEEYREFIIDKNDFLYTGDNGGLYVKDVFPMYSIPTIRTFENGQIVETEKKLQIKSSSEEETVEEEVEEKTLLTVKTEENKNQSLVSKIISIFNFKNDETEKESDVVENEIKNDIYISGYVDVDAKSIVEYIMSNNPQVMFTGGLTIENHVENYIEACRIWDINPYTIVPQVNVTGRYTFTGKVSYAQNNFLALKDQDGNFLSFDSNKEGNLAVAQVFAKASGKKVNSPFENKALDIFSRGSCKTLSEFLENLGYNYEAIVGILNTIEKIK